jgi:hypothetical protein
MKKVLPPGYYLFTPGSNQIDFSATPGFLANNLFAVINITTGKLVYAVASATSGYGGTFSGAVLTYTSSNVGQSASDALQVIYDDPADIINVNVSSSTSPLDTKASVYSGDGVYPILSSVDPVSTRDALDVNVLMSSFGGQIFAPIPMPNHQNALSVGFLNGGDLVPPAMDAISNQLQTQVLNQVDVNIAATSATIPISSSSPLDVKPAELYVTGFGPQTTLGNNVLEGISTANSTDTMGYRSAVVTIVSASTTGAYIFEQSADNVNFKPLAVFNAEVANPNAIVTAITPTSATIVYHFPIKARFIRCRISTVLNSTGIRAYIRLSSETWAPTAVQTVNATSTNLNTNVSGSLTTVSTVTTVSSMTSGNLAIPGIIADVSSSAVTTTTTSATIIPTFGPSYQVVIPVTAVTGTNPTLDISIEESDDTGTNWVRVYDFPRITGIGVYRSGPLKFRGNRLRYVQTVGGTSPSFTRSIGRLQRSDTIFSRLTQINRTIDLNTLNSTSPVMYCDGTSEFVYYIRCTAQTTAATIQIQFSDDSVNWYSPASAVLTSVVGFAKGQITDEYWRFARAIVTVAGTGVTLGEFSLKAARE